MVYIIQKNEHGAGAYGVGDKPIGKNYYTFTIEVEPKYIDWKNGFIAFLTYGVVEDEIQLLKKSPIEIISIEYKDVHKNISKFAIT